jgi:hypothetical protein
MKRASALRTCAIVGTIFSVLACSSSNPTLPPGVIPVDGGSNERGVAQSPDTRLVIDAAVVVDAGSPIDHQEASSSIDVGIDVGSDVGSAIDGAIDGGVGAIDGATDAVLASKVAVTIVSPSAVLAVDGGSGVDGGDTVTPVIAKTDRLAPTVRVEVQSQGGDPTLDVVTSIKAMLVSETTKTTSLTISLNQIQYEVIPESDSKVYIYADTPFDLSGLAGDFYTLQVTAITAGGMCQRAPPFASTSTGGRSSPSCSRPQLPMSRAPSWSQPWWWTTGRASQAWPSPSVNTKLPRRHRDQRRPVFDDHRFWQLQSTPRWQSARHRQRHQWQWQHLARFAQLHHRQRGTDHHQYQPSQGRAHWQSCLPSIGHGHRLSRGHGFLSHRGGCQWRHPLRRQPDQGRGVYQQLFDTTKLPSYTIFPSISFRAQDILGNESSMGYLVSLDNTPPMMDLDPPAHFQLIKKDGTCSWPFDPVGPDAIDDGSVVTQLFDIRARIEDMGNTPRSPVRPISSQSPPWIPPP